MLSEIKIKPRIQNLDLVVSSMIAVIELATFKYSFYNHMAQNKVHDTSQNMDRLDCAGRRETGFCLSFCLRHAEFVDWVVFVPTLKIFVLFTAVSMLDMNYRKMVWLVSPCD